MVESRLHQIRLGSKVEDVVTEACFDVRRSIQLLICMQVEYMKWVTEDVLMKFTCG